jgi:hypothetical protein
MHGRDKKSTDIRNIGKNNCREEIHWETQTSMEE